MVMVTLAPRSRTTTANVSAGASSKTPTAGLGWIGGSYLLAALGAIAGIFITINVKPAAFAPAEGFTSLALLYIAAQAIERLLEPLTKFVTVDKPEGAGKTNKEEAQARAAKALSVGYKAETLPQKEEAAQKAAEWLAAADQIRKQTSYVAWGISAFIAMILAGWIGLYLLQAVGAKGVPIELDVVVTGLAIAGGTKPLHDLIKNIEKSKEAKEDPPEAKP